MLPGRRLSVCFCLLLLPPLSHMWRETSMVTSTEASEYLTCHRKPSNTEFIQINKRSCYSFKVRQYQEASTLKQFLKRKSEQNPSIKWLGRFKMANLSRNNRKLQEPSYPCELKHFFADRYSSHRQRDPSEKDYSIAPKLLAKSCASLAKSEK